MAVIGLWQGIMDNSLLLVLGALLVLVLLLVADTIMKKRKKRARARRMERTMIKDEAKWGVMLRKRSQLPPQNCWEAKGCGLEKADGGTPGQTICPAALDVSCNGFNRGVNGGRICWTVAGTFCKTEAQGTFANNIISCAECDFYRRVREEERGYTFRGQLPSIKG
jgi:hypothetical protein